MIAPGGRGWIALNAKRMIEQDPKFSTLVCSDSSNIDIISKYINTELTNLPGNILLFDIDLTCLDNFMDGNIQIIFEKPKDNQ